MCNAAFCDFCIANYELYAYCTFSLFSPPKNLFYLYKIKIKACFSGQSLRSMSSVSSAVCLAGRKAGLFGCRLLGDSV